MASVSRNKINWIHIHHFRKLKDIRIDIGERITVIAGHNGIGKSTILGLIANGSELKGYQSYFDKIFQSQFQEIFHLDINNDYSTDKEKNTQFFYPMNITILLYIKNVMYQSMEID